MSDLLLQELEVNNFRSIRGRVYAPLDARVVLVHGENGAGKTSLLSAIELALTGKIQSLHRVDPNYSLQLLHRSAEEGYVVAKTLEAGQEQSYRALLNANGARSLHALDDHRATFFSERTFLPQAHLGQLLQIYQDAEPSANSPLAKFVSELLGLDRLDALELGLKPISDVRNIRRIVDGWSDVEHEQATIERLLEEQRTAYSALSEEVRGLTDRLAEALSTLQIVGPVTVDQLDEIEVSLRQLKDVEVLQRLSDNQRRLASIRREVAQALISAQQAPSSEGAVGENPIEVFGQWTAENEDRILGLRNRVATLLPQFSLPSDLVEFGQTALQQLRVLRDQLLRRGTLARSDQQRLGAARSELDAGQKQLFAIDAEINKMAVDAGSLSSALAELTAFISDDICPVCDRDFSEHSKLALSVHVQTKIRTLSTSADRLLTLGRSRSASQVFVEKLQGEIASLGARALVPSDVANIDRQHALATALIAELEAVATTLPAAPQL